MATISITSNEGKLDSASAVLEVTATNPDYNQPALRIKQASKRGGAASIRIDDPNPDIELIETDQTAPAGKYEIAVQSDQLQINGRNADDTAFETLVVFQRRAAGGNIGIRTASQFGAGNGVIAIAKETDSRSYLMAGAHRDANSVNSTCQISHKEADAAHNTATMFHATNQELINWYDVASWHAIQWHGMAADTCPSTDVHLSHGIDVTPSATDTISVLRNNLLVHHPTWNVDLPGAGACSLNATDNTQGRLINRVPAGSVCCIPASNYNGRFIHIEQDPSFRNPWDWINPVRDTWPIRKAM
jgi:hypothetical protein